MKTRQSLGRVSRAARPFGRVGLDQLLHDLGEHLGHLGIELEHGYHGGLGALAGQALVKRGPEQQQLVGGPGRRPVDATGTGRRPGASAVERGRVEERRGTPA